MIKDFIEKARSYRSFDESQRIERTLLLEFVNNARLAPSSVNLQPLKYKICTDENECQKLLALTKWAALIKDEEIPPKGHAPVAYVVICVDENISDKDIFMKDVGIAAQTIMLSAAEYGYGGCMIGNFDSAKVSEALRLGKGVIPRLVLGLGVPDEKILIENVNERGTAYYRDSLGHHVPKRTLDEIVI